MKYDNISIALLIQESDCLFILFFNVAGLGFLLYLVAKQLWAKYLTKEEIPDIVIQPVKKKKPSIMNDDIILDEDDLLKDMDLSDLDQLDLDDVD